MTTTTNSTYAIESNGSAYLVRNTETGGQTLRPLSQDLAIRLAAVLNGLQPATVLSRSEARELYLDLEALA